ESVEIDEDDGATRPCGCRECHPWALTWSYVKRLMRRASGGGPLLPVPGIRSRPLTGPALVPRGHGSGDRGHHAAPRGGGPSTPGPPSGVAAGRPRCAGRPVATAPSSSPGTLVRPTRH